MSDDPVARLRRDLTALADPARAAPMAAYMKDRFPFLGVAAPARRAAQKPFVAGGKHADSSALLELADACWAEPEREFQYVALDLLRRWASALESSDLPRVERLIRDRSWWDTVDHLASNVVGPMVAADPTLADTMDTWIDDDDIWIARTAILHQLKYRERTDADRLARYVDRRADDTEFFIRKALGWALREFAKVDADEVRAIVDEHAGRLSGLTRREALKHL